MRKFIVFILTFISVASSYAQHDMMLSQEIFSRANKNPAATGNVEAVTAFMHGRCQWLGVDNSPKSGVINVLTYTERIKSGYGMTVSYDHMGVGHSMTNVKAIYARHFDVNPYTVLAMGLSAGVNIGYYNPYDNVISDEREYEVEEFPQDKETLVIPDFNFGLEMTHNKWMVGASITHVQSNEMTTLKPSSHFYLYGTANCKLNTTWSLMPMLSVMHRNKTSVMELGSYAYVNKSFLWGVFLRPDLHEKFNPMMMVFTVGYESRQFRIGYTYDLGLGSNNKLPSNTHEIILSFSKEKKKHEINR